MYFAGRPADAARFAREVFHRHGRHGLLLPKTRWDRRHRPDCFPRPPYVPNDRGRMRAHLLLEKEEFLRSRQIELYDKDENMSEKIFEILNNYKNKNISENQLHNELDYLEDDYSIDIKKVKVISDVGNHGSLTFYVNGIFENMDPDYWNKLLISNLETAWK